MIFEKIDGLIGKLSESDARSKEKQFRLVAGDRRDVAVLFADIHGFTSISEKLDPEKVKILADKLMQILSFCVKNYGGFVDKYEGDRIMALFGAKKASDKDAEKAVRAAIDMIEKITLLAKIFKEDEEFKEFDLSMRIGINYGLVTTGRIGEKREGDFTVYGDTVNIASRLEEKSPLNSILVSSSVRESLKQIFEFDPFGDLELKGKIQKVEAWIAKKYKTKKTLMADDDSLFLGRENEITETTRIINSALNRAVSTKDANYLSLGFITGEPGIGKTRLLGEILKLFQGRAEFFWGSCDSLKVSRFGVIEEMVKERLGVAREDEKNAIVSKISQWAFSNKAGEDLRNNLIDLYACAGNPYNSEGRDESRFVFARQVFIEFFKTIGSKASENSKPVIIAIDDFQEADEIEVSFLECFLEALRHKDEKLVFSTFVILIASRKDIETDFGASGILQNRIRLLPLSSENSMKLLDGVLRDENIEERLKSFIIERAQGNPLFITELSKIAKKRGGENLSVSDIPSSMKSLMLSRLDCLDENLKEPLKILTVSGEKIEIDISEYVLRRFEIDPEFLISRLESEKVIYEYEKEIYRFSSLFFREIIYETFLVENRRIVHAEYAKALEDKRKHSIDNYISEICGHYLETDDDEKIIEYLEKNGKLLKERFDNKSALEIFLKLDSMLSKKYLENASSAFAYAECLLNMSEILNIAGDWELSEKKTILSLSIIGEKNLESLKGRAFLCLARAYLNLNRLKDAEHAVERSLAYSKKLKNTSVMISSMMLKGELYILFSDYKSAAKCFKSIEKKSKTAGDEKGLMMSFFNLAHVYIKKSKFKKSLEYNLMALKIAEDISDKLSIVRILNNIGIGYRNIGEFDKAFRAYQKSLKLAVEMGSKKNIATAYGNLSILYMQKGEMNEYVRFLRKHFLLNFELNDKMGMAYSLANFGNYHNYSGNLREAELSYKKGLSIAKIFKNKVLAMNLAYNLSTVYMAQKDNSKALKFSEISYKTADEIGNFNWKFLTRAIGLRIEFNAAKSLVEKNTVLKKTEEMLKDYKTKDTRAEILYRIWEFTMEYSELAAKRRQIIETYRNEAIKLFAELLKKEKKSDYSDKLENLTNGFITKRGSRFSIH
ncbi:tetratricopeptide repeat protein [candidate division WOR-3 bacterium]|nr:tetratricopeptide repeat protein [candidate division WOR-3 bacterium]